MRYGPVSSYGVPEESTLLRVIGASAGHGLKGIGHNLQQLLVAGRQVRLQCQLKGGDHGKLGFFPKSTVLLIIAGQDLSKDIIINLLVQGTALHHPLPDVLPFQDPVDPTLDPVPVFLPLLNHLG